MAYFKNQIYHSYSTNNVCVGCLFTYGRHLFRRSHHQKCYIESSEDKIHEKKSLYQTLLHGVSHVNIDVVLAVQHRKTMCRCCVFVIRFREGEIYWFFFFRASPLCSHNLFAFSRSFIHLIRKKNSIFSCAFFLVMLAIYVCTIQHPQHFIQCGCVLCERTNDDKFIFLLLA